MQLDVDPDFTNPLPCAQQAWLFFSPDYDEQQQAKDICKGCSERANCLRRALRIGGFDRYVDGVAGGFDPRERGYYLRLFGLPGRGHIQELPERFRTKPPKRRRGAA